MGGKIRLAAVVGIVMGGGIVGCDIAPGDIPPRKANVGVMGGTTMPGNQGVELPGGGVFSAGGGYIVGQLPDKTDKGEADNAGKQARENPASPQQARQSATADLNKDGFVTLDEVVAMRDAGLDDREMVRRLAATGQVFKTTATQEEALINQGVSRTVVDWLRGGSRPVSDQPATAPAREMGRGKG